MITLLLPAAGNGARFREAGYDRPKPMIDVAGRPMLQRVLDNLRPNGPRRAVIISRLEREDVEPLLEPDDTAIYLTEPTRGALETILAAKDAYSGGPLVLGNCDQLVDFDVNEWIRSAKGVDGSLVTFRSTRQHHSYVKANAQGVIEKIVEKQVISTEAVTGVYYFNDGADFMKYAAAVVDDDDRYNGEFYVSSALSRMVQDGYRLKTFDAPSAMLGTPLELQLFQMAIRVGRTL